MNSQKDAIFIERLAKLNKKQKEAVETTDGPLLVIAGPGTGKTELLSLRVAHIVKEGLALPQNILCLTFTESGTVAMRRRLEMFMGDAAYRVPVFTFHSFASHIMSVHPIHFFDAATYRVATEVEKVSLFEDIFSKLPYSHPFSKTHGDEGFIYLKDVKQRISHIKSGGYTAVEYLAVVNALLQEEEKVNTLLSLWPTERLSAKKLSVFDPLVSALKELGTVSAQYLSRELTRAIQTSEEIGKTEELASFKRKYIEAEEGGFILKDIFQKEKMLAVAEIYEIYESEMSRLGLYDFDDMILQVSHALKSNISLRSEVEEMYQYILIDEFQDTNEAQMDIVRAITSSDIHEGRPNIMVVGDDDQAVYKFQGAEVSHMMRFRERMYKDVKTIVLDMNYRSTKELLSFARQVILRGKDRLENAFPDVVKELSQGNTSLSHKEVRSYVAKNKEDEYAFVVSHIQDDIQRGVPREEIGVLARGHKELALFEEVLVKHKIPYTYQKKLNVFEEIHVSELIAICDFVSSFLSHDVSKEYLLPKILSFPFFGVKRASIYALALEVKKSKEGSSFTSWLDSGEKSDDEALQNACRVLKELAGESLSLPLKHFLDKVMHETPFKEYYFGGNVFKENPQIFVTFLESLRTFIDALAEHKEGEMLFAKDVMPFVQLHKLHGISLLSDAGKSVASDSVVLMTAHASKGLEFSSVYLIGTRDDVWHSRGLVNKAPVPFVLKDAITPLGDDDDDRIRLLYVALTRAKEKLIVTADEEMVRYIEEKEDIGEVGVSVSLDDIALVKKPLQKDEKEVLAVLLEDYKMPITHVQNFCNVIEGGPLYFLEQNLLRFPKPVIPSGAYGTAVHTAIEKMITYPLYHGGEEISKEELRLVFEKSLRSQRMPHKEEEKLLARGRDFLATFYEKGKTLFHSSDKVEEDYGKKGLVIGSARVAGKIDVLRKEGDGYHIIDIKTGEAASSWDDAKTDYTKYKLYKYKEQLTMYKLLVEIDEKRECVHELSLYFPEDGVSLSYVVQKDEEERLKKLLDAVYAKIVSLDFPDVSGYEKNSKGVIAFENDLIEGKV